MPILNYTTKIPVDRTINEIQKILAKAGANAILSEYDNEGEICALTFRIMDDNGIIHYNLPANVSGVASALKADKCFRDMPHARRVAWRIIKDWIEAQMALIHAQMAELEQVFLPYAQTSTGETVYERLKGSGMKLLGGNL